MLWNNLAFNALCFGGGGANFLCVRRNTFGLISPLALLSYHSNALISGHPRGLTPGNPRAFEPRHLQIPSTQGQYSSTKSYHCSSPGKHNFKGLPNCNAISCISFNKRLTIIYTISKNSESTCFLHTAKFSFLPCK